MEIIYQMYDLHVTCVSTLWWYYLHNCMLWDWYTNIPDCDCEHGIWHYYIYLSWLGVSDNYHFCWIWFFSFLLVNFSLCFFSWVLYKVRLSWRICSSLTIRLQLRYESSLVLRTWTGNLDLQLGPTYL